jgi:histidinol-phosphate aminotransferase
MTTLDLSAAESYSAGGSERYPDAAPLEALLASRSGVSADRVLVTAGADDALDRACRATLSTGGNALFTRPTFQMIPHYVALAGAEARRVDWSVGEFPVEDMIRSADERTRVVFVVSPNNPTGLVAGIAAIRRLHEALPGALIVADLAYVEFADVDPTAELLQLERVIVVRTLSKAWGAPGIRVGYAIGAPGEIARLRAAGGPYPVASESLRRAEGMLTSDPARADQTVASIRRNRDSLISRLGELGASVTQSQANFVCVTGDRASWLRDALRSLGIVTRYFGDEDVPRTRITVPAADDSLSRLTCGLQAAAAPECLLFDLDGVLVDVSRSYREAIVRTAARFRITLLASDIDARKARGNANDDWALTRELIESRGAQCTLDEVTSIFEQLYQGTGTEPGLREAESLSVPVAALRRLGQRLPLGVVTGRPRDDAEFVLKRFGIRDCFQVVVAREDAPLKPSPKPMRLALQRLGASTAWMLGDTVDDIASARAASVVPIGVTLNPDEAQRDTLLRSGAARVITNPMEIESWLS